MAQPLMNGATPNAPWTTNDWKQLEAAICSLAVQTDYLNRRWAQKWFENFQFVMGNQQLQWSKQYDFPIDVDFLTQRNTDFVPNDQTNISRTVVESLAAMIYAQLPEKYFEAKYDSSSRGSRLAKMLEALATAYEERLLLDSEFDIASVMLVIFDKVYGKVSWSRTAGGMFQRPRQRMVKAPKMTTIRTKDPMSGQEIIVPAPVVENGQPVMIDTWEDEVGPDGKPILEHVRNGDTMVEMCSPFEIRTDPLAKTFAKIRWIEQIRVMDYDDFMTEYGDEAGVDMDVLSKIRGGVINTPVRELAIRHFLRTMFVTPPTLDMVGHASLTSMLALKNKVFVVEHYDRPTEGHKMNPTPWLKLGRRSVLANGKLFLVSTPQYRTNKQDGWHPFVEAKWLPMAPSNEASGPMSDTVAKNRSLNMTDNLITLALKRQAGSSLLVNENAGLDKNKFTGEPGQTFYVSGDPTGAAAWLSDKNPMPSLVNQWRAAVKEDIYDVSAAQPSVRGERSVGATSGYQARLYEERERKRTSKATNNWSGFVKGIYEKIFSCTQQNAVKLDPSVISRMLRSADGDISISDVMAFLNGPIDYGVDLKLKTGSMQTKSKASQQADAAEAIKLPYVQERIVQDPAILDAYLDFMGIDVLKSIDSVHRDRAKKENAVFLDMIAAVAPQQLMAFGIDMPVVVWQDDDMIHLIEHTRDFVKNYDKFKRNPTLMRLHTLHCAKHEQNYKAKLAEQSPLVARHAEKMLEGAEATEAASRDPKTLIESLKEFAAEKEAMAAAAAASAAAAPAAGAAPPAKAEAKPAPGK